jgi:hypothetical protein
MHGCLDDGASPQQRDSSAHSVEYQRLVIGRIAVEREVNGIWQSAFEIDISAIAEPD